MMVLVWGDTCWDLVVLDQQRTVMVDTQWYWVSRGRYWMVLGDTGSVEGGKGRKYLVSG